MMSLKSVRVLSKRLASDSEALARFRSQAQAVGALDHPNLVTVYEIGTHDGVPSIAMEYVRGQTLARLLAAKETPPDALVAGEGLPGTENRGIAGPREARRVPDGWRASSPLPTPRCLKSSRLRRFPEAVGGGVCSPAPIRVVGGASPNNSAPEPIP